MAKSSWRHYAQRKHYKKYKTQQKRNELTLETSHQMYEHCNPLNTISSIKRITPNKHHSSVVKSDSAQNGYWLSFHTEFRLYYSAQSTLARDKTHGVLQDAKISVFNHVTKQYGTSLSFIPSQQLSDNQFEWIRDKYQYHYDLRRFGNMSEELLKMRCPGHHRWRHQYRFALPWTLTEHVEIDKECLADTLNEVDANLVIFHSIIFEYMGDTVTIIRMEWSKCLEEMELMRFWKHYKKVKLDQNLLQQTQIMDMHQMERRIERTKQIVDIDDEYAYFYHHYANIPLYSSSHMHIKSSLDRRGLSKISTQAHEEKVFYYKKFTKHDRQVRAFQRVKHW